MVCNEGALPADAAAGVEAPGIEIGIGADARAVFAVAARLRGATRRVGA